MPQTNSRHWFGLGLLFAAILLPVGATQAKDEQAKADQCLKQVWAKLEAAVEAGKMSAEDAKAKMAAIKKAKLGSDKQAIDIETVGKKLKAAVEAGKLTEEQAKAKWVAIKKAKLGSCKQAFDVEAVGKKLKAAVEAGKLTEEEAKAKWVAIKKGAFGKPKK